jgi:uncharacterized protein (TIGR00730 family)
MSSMNASFRNITVYCGSADDLKPVYHLAARQMGRELAARGIGLVYGGGKTGLMGALADSVLSHGGKVLGVVPDSLNQPQLIHAGLSAIEQAPDIQTRQRRMMELSDASIALPGGLGTFYELIEVLTWAQLGLRVQPVGLLNTAGYFDPLLVLIEHGIHEGFIYPEHRDLLIVSETSAELLDKLAVYAPPASLARWLTREKPEPKHDD